MRSSVGIKHGHCFLCSCADFKKFRHLCPLTIALADFQQRLFGHLQDVMERFHREEAAEVLPAIEIILRLVCHAVQLVCAVQCTAIGLRLRSDEMTGKKPSDRRGSRGSAGVLKIRQFERRDSHFLYLSAASLWRWAFGSQANGN